MSLRRADWASLSVTRLGQRGGALISSRCVSPTRMSSSRASTSSPLQPVFSIGSGHSWVAATRSLRSGGRGKSGRGPGGFRSPFGRRPNLIDEPSVRSTQSLSRVFSGITVGTVMFFLSWERPWFPSQQSSSNFRVSLKCATCWPMSPRETNEDADRCSNGDMRGSDQALQFHIYLAAESCKCLDRVIALGERFKCGSTPSKHSEVRRRRQKKTARLFVIATLGILVLAG